MDLRKKVLSGLYWSAGARFLGQLVTWTITIIVMRLLTPEDYGLMALAGLFVNLLVLLNELGLGAALIQKKEISEETLRQTFGLLLLVNIGIFLFLLLISPMIGSFFNEKRIIPIIRLLSTQFIIMSFSIIPQSLIDRRLDFKNKSIVDLVSAIAGCITTLLLTLTGAGVWSLVWGSLAIVIFRTVGLNFVSPYFHEPNFSIKGMQRIISFGGYVMITRTLWFFFTQADIFIIGKILGKELLGFYSVAMNLASLPMEKVSGIINQVAFPAFSSIQTEHEKAASHFLKSVRVMSFFAFPILWGISSISPELVGNLLGKKWDMATLPLQLLSLMIPLRMISNLMSPAIMGLGRPEILFRNVLLASVVMPITILVGAYWGIVGVSFAWVIFYPIVFLRNLSRVAPVLGVKSLDVLSAMVNPALAAVIMYITIIGYKILFSSDTKSILNLVSIIIIGIMAYGGVLLIINRERYHEVLELLRG
jgi:teichuronic acid exporter